MSAQQALQFKVVKSDLQKCVFDDDLVGDIQESEIAVLIIEIAVCAFVFLFLCFLCTCCRYRKLRHRYDQVSTVRDDS